jgi:hypothetical protein
VIEKGYLILADITGYTQFLNESELEHAKEIITGLINAILKPIQPPIILHRIEGDAVFAYTTKNAFLQGQTLLESLEKLYFEFAHDLESNDRNTTCNCRACQNMDSLNLKLVVHYGEFGMQTLGSHDELIGSDVIVAHRLLKNSIPEKTGVKAYLFLSETAVDEMLLGNFVKTLVPHTESYEDCGEVKGFVYDLAPVWMRERERHKVFISPQDAFASTEFDLPVTPPIAWDYLNEPSSRARYREYDDTPITGLNIGRVDVGTTYHCAHGDSKTPETILDWKPFEYVTFQSRVKMMDFTGIIQFTVRLEPTAEGTHVSVHYSEMIADPRTLLSRLFLPVMGLMFKKMALPSNGKSWSKILHEMIEEDRGTGRLKMKMISAQANLP